MGSVLGGTYVEYLPFEVFGEGLEGLEGYFEGKWGEEGGGIVEDLLFTIMILLLDDV